MSKGGAGKVYFVLYLAVILELLIIIVERDEAEEHLIAKQKESMRIVESILSQLQVGAGTEGINTRPQDQITIPPPGINVKEAIGADIKPERKYLIEVGVTDVSSSLKMNEGEEPEDYMERLKRFVRLSNVTDLKYEVLHSTAASDETVPAEDQFTRRSETQIDLNIEEMEGQVESLYQQFKTDQSAFVQNLKEKLLDAQYKTGPATGFKPGNVNEPEFFYSQAETAGLKDKSSKKRVFIVNFEPKEEGWYKLRFSSKTNKVLGVVNKGGSGVEVDPESKVNIGTVQLKVKDLYKVQNELTKNISGLPPATLAASNHEEFEAALTKMKEDATDPDTKSKIELYGYIVKLVTPGAGDFDQNKGYIEYNIRVLKPQPQITDPKIADLRNVVRVFDKLAAIKLPMQVTPANGQTVIIKNPGGATVGGSSATASSSGGGGTKWVGKELVIPIAGNLVARDEPYIVELQQKNGPKASEAVQCSIYVYSSKIVNDAEVKSALELSWGDYVELVATPASTNVIPPEQFIMQFNLGGSTQTPAIRKLSVGQSDKVIVPPGAEKVALTISWKDPQSGDVVELFNGSGDVGLKKPIIITNDTKADPIFNNQDPEFKVKPILIRAAAISEDEKADIVDVDVNVQSSSVRDLKSNTNYKVVPVGKPRKVGQDWEITLKLTGGKQPLPKGQVKGSVTLTMTAASRAQGTTSKPQMKTFTVGVTN